MVLQIEALLDLGETLNLLGRGEGTAAAFDRAHRLATEKGSAVLVARVLQAASTTTAAA